MTFIGGCSGSTAGGLKAYRFIILFNAIRAGVNRLVYPDAIYHVRYGGKTVMQTRSAPSSCSSSPICCCGCSARW